MAEPKPKRKINVAAGAGRTVEKTFTLAGKAISGAPRVARKHPKSAIALGAYGVGYASHAVQQQRNAERTNHEGLASASPGVQSRAEDRHPYGGYYG